MMRSKPCLPSLHAARSLTRAPVETEDQIPMGWHTEPSLSGSDPWSGHKSVPQAIEWAREAESLTISLDQGLLVATRHAMPGVTGELLWIYQVGHARLITLYVHPMLVVHTADEPVQQDRIKMVPHLHPGDPLLHHMTLVLQATIDAEEVPGRLYAETLTNALAVHLLRRYETCQPAVWVCPSSLSKPKLQRTTAYIEAHLAQELSVTELAAAAQTSPAYFARLFRQATGQTPHQYVIKCRIERAKRMLEETEMPISEIALRSGFSSQSHFTTAFRRLAGATPKAFRAAL